MRHKKRTICVITGSRAEYGLLRPILTLLKKDRRFVLQIIATGAHLSRRFGFTVKEIEKDGFFISKRVSMTPESDSLVAFASSLGRGVIGISKALAALRPDMTLLLGDRVEALAGALASAYMNIPVAHIHGGDSAGGGLDEYARHAITKIAHLHLPATEKSAERIRKMGEEPSRIVLCGSPGLDDLHRALSAREVERKYGVKRGTFLLLLLHPVTTAAEDAEKEMREVLFALREISMETIAMYPNADAGGRVMSALLEREKKSNPKLRVFKNVPRADYLGLLKASAALVGNSSSGIIEAPAFQKAAINIGTRQEGRERGGNVIDVPFTKTAIVRATAFALENRQFQKRLLRLSSPYGKGTASKKIVETLGKIPLTKALLEKRLTY